MKGNRSINRANELSNYGGDVSITFQSVPNHDGWGPDTWWSAADWIAWYNELVKEKGTAEAQRIWANEYDKSSYGAAEINYAVKNEEFKKFVQSTGLAQKSTILSKLFRAEASVDKAIAPIGDVYKGVGDLLGGAGNALGNVGDAADKATDSLGDALKWLPWIALAGGLLIAFFYFKSLTKVAGV